MLTVRLFSAPLALLLAAGCAGEPNEKLGGSHASAGKVILKFNSVTDDDSQLSLIMVNRSSSKIVINGLFSSGFRESPVKYEFQGSNVPQGSDVHEASSAVIINPAEYRITLHPGDIYGTLVNKKIFSKLYGLSSGQCYKVRAVYKSADKRYTKGVWASNFSSVCF